MSGPSDEARLAYVRRKAPRCTTHSYACPCREWRMRELEMENAALVEQVQKLQNDLNEALVR